MKENCIGKGENPDERPSRVHLTKPQTGDKTDNSRESIEQEQKEKKAILNTQDCSPPFLPFSTLASAHLFCWAQRRSILNLVELSAIFKIAYFICLSTYHYYKCNPFFSLITPVRNTFFSRFVSVALTKA